METKICYKFRQLSSIRDTEFLVDYLLQNGVEAIDVREGRVSWHWSQTHDARQSDIALDQ
jgi:hypothetical protein